MLKMLTDFFPIMFNKTLCKWIGVSRKTMARKAKELGLKKADNFKEIRKSEFSEKVSEGVKRAYADGRLKPRFGKGESFCPNTEFKEGNKFDGKTEAKRVEKLHQTYKKKKLLSIYGLKHEK